MTIGISRSQAEHLAALVHAIRPDWDAPGILAALVKVRTRPLALVAYAAVRAAENTSNRTPAVIALDGTHWRPPTAAELPTPIPPSKCDRCGGFWRDPHGACLDCNKPAGRDEATIEQHRTAARAAIHTTHNRTETP